MHAPVPAAEASALPAPLADGIYFGLDEKTYHADLALGSTDMKRLYYSPADYWFESGLNPLREDDESKVTPALLRGRAVHRFVLEGRDAFLSEYAPTEFPGNIKAGKDEREAIAARGMIPLPRKDYDRVLQSGTMIRANRYLAEAFSDGRSEVSVFWTDERVPGSPIRKKARFDFLKWGGIVDLKSITNTMGIEFPRCCRNAIAQRDYPIQAVHYCEGRQTMAAHVAAGRVYGEHDADWLTAVAQKEKFAFTWVFWQAEGAPLTWGAPLSYPDNPIFDVARNFARRADENYRACMQVFGLHEPWVSAEPLAELDISDLPAWWGR